MMDVREKAKNDKRLIDANALLDEFLKRYTERERNGNLVFAACEIKQDFADMISNVPNVDAVEVVHGRWIEQEKYTFGTMYDCSICDNRILDNGHSWNYCPNCGARMDGGAD